MSDPKPFLEGLKELGEEFECGVSEDGNSILKVHRWESLSKK